MELELVEYSFLIVSRVYLFNFLSFYLSNRLCINLLIYLTEDKIIIYKNGTWTRWGEFTEYYRINANEFHGNWSGKN